MKKMTVMIGEEMFGIEGNVAYLKEMESKAGKYTFGIVNVLTVTQSQEFLTKRFPVSIFSNAVNYNHLAAVEPGDCIAIKGRFSLRDVTTDGKTKTEITLVGTEISFDKETQKKIDEREAARSKKN